MIFHNIFFFQELRTELNGPKDASYEEEKVLEIPEEVFILAVRLFFNKAM